MKARDFLLANPKLFKCDTTGIKRYYVFVDGENQEVYYEFLAYLLSVLHIPNHESAYPLHLELNPLIYKIILNQCQITDDFFTSEDVKYYAYEYYNNWESLSDEEKKGSLNEMKSEYSKILPQIKMFYNGICKFFNVDGFNLLSWFEKNEFLLLKEFFEGSVEITYEMFEKMLVWNDVYCGMKDNASILKQIFLNMIKGFSSEQRRKLLVFLTGIDSVGLGQQIEIKFFDSLVVFNELLPLKAYACTNNFHINVSWMMSEKDPEKTFKTCLKNALLTADIFTAK
ncbi:MAG: hypothetical protein II393_01730 [Cytophagales bacterium]|nr:hypothetical protein [Cytophagales bacterium]